MTPTSLPTNTTVILGYLAYKKPQLTRTLPQTYAQGPAVVLGEGGAGTSLLSNTTVMSLLSLTDPIDISPCPLASKEGRTVKVLRTFAYKPRPESGRDCLTRAIFAWQQKRDRNECTPGQFSKLPPFLKLTNKAQLSSLEGTRPGNTRQSVDYRSASLAKKRTPLRPYRRHLPGFIGGSQGGRRFLMGEVPLYTHESLVPPDFWGLRDQICTTSGPQVNNLESS